MQRIGVGDRKAEQAPLYAVAYHVIHQDEQSLLDLWYHSLAVGEPLPTMPLWLQDGPCVPVELDVVYARTCREQRIAAEVEVVNEQWSSEQNCAVGRPRAMAAHGLRLSTIPMMKHHKITEIALEMLALATGDSLADLEPLRDTVLSHTTPSPGDAAGY
ncbi:MAG: hypothetical protein R2932_20655 [Caldilineaceae bacterium]